jgi:hypothetical protein
MAPRSFVRARTPPRAAASAGRPGGEPIPRWGPDSPPASRPKPSGSQHR